MIIKIFYSFAITLLSIYFIKNITYHKRWIAYPRKDRWHKRPVSLYGGVGIVGGIYLSLLIPPYPFTLPLTFLVLSLFVFFIGLFDDIKPFSPSFKFVLEMAITSFVIFSGGKIHITGRFLIDVFITYLWILGITNAFNLLDNMDGLSSGIGIIVSSSLLFLIISNGGGDFSILFLSLIISAYGAYLVFNFPPAKIFMGDAGSLFLGFTLSVLSIPGYFNSLDRGIHSLFAILLIFSLPIFDTTLVTLNRLYYGKKASEGGKDHTSHRLVFLGFSEMLVDIVLYIISMIGGILGIYYYRDPGTGIFLGILYVILLVFFGRYLSKLNVYKTKPKGIVFVIEELLQRIRASEIVMDTILIGSAYYFAFFMHYEGAKRLFGKIYVKTLPFAIFISLFFFVIMGIYRTKENPLSFREVESVISAIILSDILIKLFAYWFARENVIWEVLVTYSLLWFFLFISSRSMFSYFDYLIEKIRRKSH